MATEKQQQSLDQYVEAIHELLLDQIHGIRSRGGRQIKHSRKIFIRILGQVLYEAPKLHTGMVSVRLVEQKLKNFQTKPCPEHHHSRQKGGSALVHLIDHSIASDTDPTKQQVREMVMKYCQVHYTTPHENKLLRKHQGRCSSEAAYRRARVTLIDARELFTRRGRHNEAWKEEMRAKYQPIVDAYNNPTYQEVDIELPLVIN